MNADRRQFLGHFALGAATFGGVHAFLPLDARVESPLALPLGQEKWDLSWVNRLSGKKHKAIFDVPEVESGYGVWRSSIWANQYQDAMGVALRDTATVLILRHNGIALAMKQEFWDEYGLGKAKNVTHPLTLKPTDRNPALLSVKDGVPEPFDQFALDKFMARGGIVLACNLAFQDCVGLVKEKHKLSDDASYARAKESLVPGIIMQPSGVFAAVRAQEAGCVYVRAS